MRPPRKTNDGLQYTDYVVQHETECAQLEDGKGLRGGIEHQALPGDQAHVQFYPVSVQGLYRRPDDKTVLAQHGMPHGRKIRPADGLHALPHEVFGGPVL